MANFTGIYNKNAYNILCSNETILKGHSHTKINFKKDASYVSNIIMF